MRCIFIPGVPTIIRKKRDRFKHQPKNQIYPDAGRRRKTAACKTYEIQALKIIGFLKRNDNLSS
jgi:Tfp pilus assembly protein PilP